jgi:hypothetical protein
MENRSMSVVRKVMTIAGAAACLGIINNSAEARTPERMMQDCRIRAHEVLHTRLPNIETKYEGQRTDGTHAVNGTAVIRGRTETFQCSFNRRGRRITQFVVNQHNTGGDDYEPETRDVRVRFPSGQNGTELSDQLGPGHSVRYMLRARKRQDLYVRVASQNPRLYFNIFTPDGGMLYESARDKDSYRGQLWLNGDHIVEVYNRGRRPARYNVIFGLSDPNQSSGNNADFARVRSDCENAVARQVGGRRVSVIDVKRGENFLTVRVRVPGAQAPWICEHSSRNVMSVYYGSEG